MDEAPVGRGGLKMNPLCFDNSRIRWGVARHRCGGMKKTGFPRARAAAATLFLAIFAGGPSYCGGSSASAKETPRPKPEAAAVKVNRTVPKVQPLPATPRFSKNPVSLEFFQT